MAMSTEEQQQNQERNLAGVPTLGELAISDRYFWIIELEQQLSLKVCDRDEDGSKVLLPRNQLLTMAFNEVAWLQGIGFFFWMPSRESFQEPSDDILQPASRASPQPSADFPSIVFKRFVWDERTHSGFSHESQRGRYLHCSGLINPPPEVTPLYAIQVAARPDEPLYITSKESLVILETGNAMYLATTNELESVVGRWLENSEGSTSEPTSGPDPGMRLNAIPCLWDEEVDLVYEAMQSFRVDSLETVYEKILAKCRDDGLTPSFSASELAQLVPRPTNPEPGEPFGTTGPAQDG